MSDSLLLATLAGLGGMLGWGFADFFAKKTIDVIGDVASLLWAHTIASILLIGYLASQYVGKADYAGFPIGTAEWLWLVFYGVLQALVYIFVYRGFFKGKLAVLNPVFSSYAGMAALLSIIFLGEVISPGLITALVVIFVGILLISLDVPGLMKRNIKFIGHPGLNEILIATVLAAGWTVMWANFVSGKDWKIYASLMYIFMTLTIYVYAWRERLKLKVKKVSTWLFLLGIGLGEILAYVSISYGFSETTHTSVIALLSGAFALPVIVLSYVFLKERLDLIHRIGTLVIIAGIAIISLA